MFSTVLINQASNCFRFPLKVRVIDSRLYHQINGILRASSKFGQRRLVMNNKSALTVAFRSHLLGDKSRNEEAINSTRNMIYSLKAFLLPTLSTSILFIVSDLI